VGIVGIILAIVALIFLMVKGFHVYAASLVAVIILGLLGDVGGVTQGITYWVSGIGNSLQTYWMLFIAGGITGYAMRISGAAASIGKALVKIMPRTLLPISVMFISTIMGYGGISVFTGFFIIIPIATEVFKAADLPVRLMPAAIVAGGSLAEVIPGSIQVQNIVPYDLLRKAGYAVTPMYGGAIGWISSLIGYLFIVFMFLVMINNAKKRGEGFSPITRGPCVGLEIDTSGLPNPIVAAIPLVIALLLRNIQINGGPVFSQSYIPIFIGAALTLILQWKRIDFKKFITEDLGAAMTGSVSTLLTYVSVIAVASVVQKTAVFPSLIDALMEINGPPLFSVFLIANITAGLTGSSMGAEGIVIPMLAEPYIGGLGVDPGAFGRVVAFSVEGLNTLPQNGGVLAILTACGETHKSAYMPIFMLTVVGTTFMSFVSVVLYSIFL